MTVRVRDVVAYGLAVKSPKVQVHDAVVYGASQRQTQVKLHDAVVYGASPRPPQGAVGDVQALLLMPDVRPTEVYDAGALLLVDDQTPPLARNPVTLALTRDTVQVPNWTLDGQTWLKGLLTKEYGGNWVSAPVLFSDPQPLAVGQFNSDVQLAVIPGKGLPYSGKMRFKYHRWSLVRALEGKDTSGFTGYGKTLVESLPAINAAFGLNLSSYDVVDFQIPAGLTQVPVTIASTSLMYTPGTRVTLGAAKTMASNLTSTDLPGFDPA